MGTKAFLQKGRTKPGLVLPANAVERVNQASDRSALVRAAAVANSTETATKSAKTVGSMELQCSAILTVTPPEAPPPEPPPKPKPSVSMPSDSPAEVVQDDEVIAPLPPLPTERLEPVETGTGAVPATMQPHPIEPDPEPPKPGLPADTALTVVAGIGTALAERFAAYGYRTLVDLAKADPETINEIPGSRKRGQQWVDEAKARLGS